jgi:hypothetical protein
MKFSNLLKTALIPLLIGSVNLHAQKADLLREAEQAMVKATQFMVDSVSVHGGYVWYYLPDLSRRWGEMEAYKTMIWMQDGGTVNVGHVLLDAYRATKNEYFYQAAEKAAAALIWAQSNTGGWNYMMDFAGDRSLKNWYNTIGKNGWRLEEFQHYYGNDTFDDDVSSNAARFLLRMYIEKLDPKYKPALDKAVNFILKSQYANGGWPQRYPIRNDFHKAGHPDYSSFYTYNDDVIGENLNFLIQCYLVLGEERFLEPIHKAMKFYALSQQKNGAWGQQYNLKMEVAGARTYEPAAYLPRTTFANAFMLLKFYQYTGDRNYLAHIPAAIQWLEKVKLPAGMTQGGRFTHSLFVSVENEKPIFVHRKGSNVDYGYYYTDTMDTHLLGHMQGKGYIDVQRLKDEYVRISALPVAEATKDSPLKPMEYKGTGTPQTDYVLNPDSLRSGLINESRVKEIIGALDERNRWLVKHVMTSNPYIGPGVNKEPTEKFASTNVGDQTDTSPYRDLSDQLYISTPEYIRNIALLSNYILSNKK